MDPLAKQLAIGQTVALISLIDWMTQQPWARRGMLNGLTPMLGGAPVIMKHLGEPELGLSLAKTAAAIIDRSQTLPEGPARLG